MSHLVPDPLLALNGRKEFAAERAFALADIRALRANKLPSPA
jgi:hypothetical protein